MQQLEIFARFPHACSAKRATRSEVKLEIVKFLTIERSQRELERDRGGGTNYTDLVIEMHVLGTAIVEVEQDERSPDTYLDLQLNDPRETT